MVRQHPHYLVPVYFPLYCRRVAGKFEHEETEMTHPEWIIQTVDLLILAINVAAWIAADAQAQRVKKPEIENGRQEPVINLYGRRL